MKQSLPGFWERPAFLGVCAVLAAGLALAAVAPALREMPNLDAGTFLYAGSQILKGKLPYLDFFEFRPPLVLYINALGLGLARGSRWGVWALEWLSLAATALFAFLFLRKYFNRAVAAVVVVVMLFNLAHFFAGGNLAEEFGLPLQFLCLLCLAQIAQGEPVFWRGLTIGLALGALSSLWLPLVGFGVAIAIYLLYRSLASHELRKILPLVWMVAGFILVWMGWVAFFKISGNLSKFWADGILYYYLYISTLTLDKINAVWNQAVDLFRYSSLVVIGVMGWAAALPFLWINDEKHRQLLAGRFAGIAAMLAGFVLLLSGLVNDQGRFYALKALSLYRIAEVVCGLLALGIGIIVLSGWVKQKVLPWLRTFGWVSTPSYAMPLTLAWIDLVFELGFAVFTWRGFEQYFVFLLPSLAILAAFILDGLSRVNVFASAKFSHFFWTLPLGIGLLASSILGSTLLTVDPHVTSDDTIKQASKSEVFLKSGQGAGLSFLQWGMQTRLYYILGQVSPTRYSFLAPLYLKRPYNQLYLEDFFEQLRASRPGIILDTRQEDQPLIVPEDGQCSQLDTEAFIHDWLLRDQKSRYRYTEKPLPYVPDNMAAVYHWVCENYQPSELIGDSRWVVYRLRQK